MGEGTDKPFDFRGKQKQRRVMILLNFPQGRNAVGNFVKMGVKAKKEAINMMLLS